MNENDFLEFEPDNNNQINFSILSRYGENLTKKV